MCQYLYAYKTTLQHITQHRTLTDLQICGQSHVNLLAIRGDSVQQQGVVQGAVPHSFEAVESPERVIEEFSGEIFNCWLNLHVQVCRILLGSGAVTKLQCAVTELTLQNYCHDIM